MFIRDLLFAKELKEFELFGYAVLSDHVHILFQPRGKANYSEVMRSIKTNFSRNANDILLNRVDRFKIPSAGDVTSHRLRTNSITNTNDVGPNRLREYQQHYLNVVIPLYRRYVEAHGTKHRAFPFQWQSSFRDHIIRGENDYLNHIEYIYNNAVRHGLAQEPEQYPYLWIAGMRKPFAPD